ncbi:hypothetical protein JMJ56_27610 [Belnapia sp. T18]|uniref:ABM domain-containing protein n=1 Tax=Belnapia arida TaxID=2804533 RepID=A0ABS1UAN9_9PROT|nr:hypothetical protein [Belnapia arida]MBL6081754.1 hypothetical protein [Belnapia arida]
MYMVVSHYAGGASDADEVTPKIERGFVPLLKQHPGFNGYALVQTEQGDIIAITLFHDSSSSAAFRPTVRPWMNANIPAVPEPADRFSGESKIHAMVAPKTGSDAQSLYCLVQRVENLPGREIMGPIVQGILARTQAVTGFRGAYHARSGEDESRGCGVVFFDTKQQANEAHEANLTILRELQPNVRLRVVGSGQTRILAMA